MKLQGSNNVKSTVETIIKTFEHHPSIKLITWPATPGGPGGHGSFSFLLSKKEKGRQRQKRKGFKAETIKRLSPRSKYYCFSHSRAPRI